MKRAQRVLLICSLFACSSFSFAQADHQAAVLFLLMSPSAQANAMGGAYGASVQVSPMASLANPASAGIFAQSNVFGSEYYPDPINLVPEQAGTLAYNVRGATLGLTSRPFRKLQVSIGLAFNNVNLDMGKIYVPGEVGSEPIAVYNAWEKAQGTTLAIALQYYLRASMGYTFKHIESQLGPSPADLTRPVTAEINAHDFGVILQLPLADITQRWTHRRLGRYARWGYWLDPGIYYSRNNIGGKISYLDELQGDPLPRTLSMGLNLQAGINYHNLTLLSFGWAHEVDDFLVEMDQMGQSRYLTGLNDIHFWDHVIAGKGSRELTHKKGYEIGLADIYFIRRGRVEDNNYAQRYRTSGYGINFLQPVRMGLRLMNMERTWLARVLANLSFEKHHAEYDVEQSMVQPIRSLDTYVFRFSNRFF